MPTADFVHKILQPGTPGFLPSVRNYPHHSARAWVGDIPDIIKCQYQLGLPIPATSQVDACSIGNPGASIRPAIPLTV